MNCYSVFRYPEIKSEQECEVSGLVNILQAPFTIISITISSKNDIIAFRYYCYHHHQRVEEEFDIISMVYLYLLFIDNLYLFIFYLEIGTVSSRLGFCERIILKSDQAFQKRQSRLSIQPYGEN